MKKIKNLSKKEILLRTIISLQLLAIAVALAIAYHNIFNL